MALVVVSGLLATVGTEVLGFAFREACRSEPSHGATGACRSVEAAWRVNLGLESLLFAFAIGLRWRVSKGRRGRALAAAGLTASVGTFVAMWFVASSYRRG